MKNKNKENNSGRLFIGDSVIINTEAYLSIAAPTCESTIGKIGVVIGFYSDAESISLTDRKTLIKVFIPDVVYPYHSRWWWNVTNFDITKIEDK